MYGDGDMLMVMKKGDYRCNPVKIMSFIVDKRLLKHG
jgi:hypothetical protein